MKTATLLLFLAIASADVDDGRTQGEMNGRAWRGIPHATKIGYVAGLSDGVMEIMRNACGKAPNSQWGHECIDAAIKASGSALGESTGGEIVEGVDDFYRDPANVQIPVPNAMKYFQLKVQGAKPDKLAVVVAEYRRQAADVQ
jgi:hypothetical protein